MDIKVRKKVAELQQSLEQEEQRISLSDPVAKMMLVAMAHQSCEIERRIDETSAKLASRFSDEILLNTNIQALPAVTIAHIGNGKETMPFILDENDYFTYKNNKCNYRPIYRTRIVPGQIAACIIDNTMLQTTMQPVKATWPDSKHKNELWIAYRAENEVTSLEDVTIALTHPLPTEGLMAEVGDVSISMHPLMDENPCTLNSNFMLQEFWKKSIVNQNLWLYKFGQCQNARVLHRGEIPAWIRDSFNSDILDPLVGQEYLWIRVKADDGISLPLDTVMLLNCTPLVNYDIQDVKLNYSEPIQSLENEKTGSYFIGVVQNADLTKEYFIRDFDVTQYDNERIREDITSLYHHYVNDYFAFVDNNALHDGATLRSLRQSMMQVYDSLDEFRSGTLRPYRGAYAIRNPRNNQQPIVVSYFTTNGARGNELRAGIKLNATNAAVGDVEVLLNAIGGRDKVNDLHTKQELARHTANSNDRIFTRIDLIQYCKVEFMRAFGEDAIRYCNITLSDGNTIVDNHIEKCITINFNFSSDNLREQVSNSDFFKYLEVNIELRKSFSWSLNLTM